MTMAPPNTGSSPGDASNAIDTKANSINAPIACSPRSKASTKKAKREKLDLSGFSTDNGVDNTGSSSFVDLDFGSGFQSSQSKALNETCIGNLNDVHGGLHDASHDDLKSSYHAYDPHDVDYDFPAAYNAERSSKEGDTRPTGKYTNKDIRRILATLDKTPKTSKEGKQARKKSKGNRME